MKNIKIAFIVIYLLSFFSVKSQDTSLVEENDTVYFENRRNYLGINVTPLFTSAFGGENKNIKVNLTYKRNRGDKNFRFSANYLTLANKTPYYTFAPIASTDTSITNRYFESDYKSYDFRIGFEEIKGGGAARFHIGADLIFGYAKFFSNYRDNELILDSIGRYVLQKDVQPIYTGNHTSDYYMTGLDISFGIDWFLDKEFMITLQITPQFNYYIANTETLIDQFGQYNPIQNFVDFKLNFIDIMLFYKF